MSNDKLKKSLPYIGVFFGFLFSLYILFLIMDNLILPAIVHDVEQVDVPDLIGMSYDEAMEILEAQDLQYKKYIEQFNDEYPENYVINQTPKPNTTVKSGRHILLTVSKGGESVKMPRITGKPVRTARVELMKRGIYISNLDYIFSDSIGVDTVMSQSIYPGKNITFGTEVSLTISKGSKAEIEVPILSGKTLNEVEDILAGLGLELGTISNTYDDIFEATFLRNTVVNQFPQPGELVSKNSKIDITLFR